MYSIGDFAALISEDQKNWRKLIYENRNAYVGGRNSIGRHFFGQCTWSGAAATSSTQYFKVNRKRGFSFVIQGDGDLGLPLNDIN